MRKILFTIYILMCSNGIFASPKYDKLAHRLMFDYAKTLRVDKGFALSAFGGSMRHDIEKISLNFISFDHLDVEGARKQYVEVVEGLLRRVNADEKIRPYLHNYPFTAENVKIMIGFEDKKRQIRADGCVAHMFVTRRNIISYLAYDQEKQDYYDLHEETYEEALKIVCGDNLVEK